jgi:UDP-glucose 4-epimerase
MVVPSLARQAVRDEALTVHGDGGQSRCFCHVKDVVRALVGLLDEPRAVGEVFNVGASQETTILELAEQIVGRAGSSSAIDLVPYDVAFPTGFEDMRRRVPDTTKILDLIGWSPQHTLDDILAAAIDDARREFERSDSVVIDIAREEYVVSA